MDEAQREEFAKIGAQADELLDQVESALEEHAQFSFMLKTRVAVEELSQRFNAAIAVLDEKDRMQIERTVGRRMMDVRRMAGRLPAPPVGKPAEKRVDTGFFETRAGTSSRQPITIGAGARGAAGKYRVAGEVEAWCGRCMSMRTQTIAAMLGDQPAQVVCPVCGSRSRYRDSPTARSKKDEAPKATTTSTLSASDKAQNAKAKEKKELIDTLRTAESARQYSPKERYKAGEIIEHPEHGRGKIENTLPRSLLVRFPSGLKTLKLG